MTPTRLSLLLVAGCWLMCPSSSFADEIASPFGPNRQFSADMEITTQNGQTITQKVYSDNGKMRTEISMQSGMQMVSIVRPDQQKVYSVMTAQKMVMEMPYDPAKYKKLTTVSSGPDGKFELIGPDTVDGVACTKYKVTSSGDNKVFYMWVDASKDPVKMTADDGSFTVLWKNYKAGPQDASLFEPPADYQKMTMPVIPGGMPGGAPGGGQ